MQLADKVAVITGAARGWGGPMPKRWPQRVRPSSPPTSMTVVIPSRQWNRQAGGQSPPPSTYLTPRAARRWRHLPWTPLAESTC